MQVPAARSPAGWPGQCEICRRWTRGRLCDACAPAAAATRCEGCGLRLHAAALRCGTCLAHPLPLARCRCAVDYAEPWDRLVVRFKYRGDAGLAGTLARRLADAVPAAEAAAVDWVLPMPLAPRRLAERGYNQAWELARRLARLHRRPASARLLQRWLEAAPQAGLDRAARRRNLQGAFAVPQPAALAGRHVALVDDVLTTGATVAEAAQTLLGAGAASVQAWVLARTP
jgi:ComF family protein